MTLPQIKYIALPRQWPGRPRPAGWKPKKSPFKGHNWSRIERELQDEVARINGRDLTVALDVRKLGDFRADGGLRADARPETSRIVVSFTRPDSKRFVFPADAYAFWQDNAWGIRLSLEALRAVDRHGVTQGDQQYAGFAALTSGGMTVESALEFLARVSGLEEAALAFPAVLAVAVQKARNKTHPDTGGSVEQFQKLEEAVRVLGAEL